MDKAKKITKSILIILIYLLICLLSCILIFISSCYIECKKINVSASSEVIKQNILYSNGECLIPNTPNVKLEELNKHTLNAFISIEDKNFYNHSGFNIKRMIKATLTNLKSFSIKEGASTITQQLIKNKYLSNEKSLKRKVKEIILAQKLENTSSKNNILEDYLNTIYFGHGCYGIEEASNYYFNKNASNLNLGESCILASIIKAPTYYSPINNYDVCIRRKNIVLNEMLKDKKISKEEYNNALNYECNFNNTSISHTNPTINDINLCNYIYKEAEEILGISKQNIIKNKYKITTTLDTSKQELLKKSILNPNFYHKNKNGFIADGLGIIIDNATNKILAHYSNSDYDVYSANRQPGSAIKPILVYAPAFELGIATPDTKILDEPIKIGNYSPQNLGGINYGYVTINDAIAKSLNIPAVKIMEKIGIERSKNFAKKLGIEFNSNDSNYAIALGGFTNGIKLKDLTNAYTPFACNGEYKDCYIIDEIRNQDNILIYKNCNIKEQAMSEATAYLTTRTLNHSVKTGTSKKLNTLNFDIAGKTGTVCVKNSNLNTDCFSIAYTSDISVGVWLGNYSYQKDKMLEGSNNGGTYATEIIKDILQNEYKNIIPANFDRPSTIVTKNIDAYEYEYKNNIYSTNNNNGIQMEFNSNFLPSEKTLKHINLDEYLKVKTNNNYIEICVDEIKNIEIKLKKLKTNQIYYSIKFNDNVFKFNVDDGGKYEIIVNNISKNNNIVYFLNNNIVYV